ncbi:MAG: cyclic nucleotide-binding domain-containing protein [Streptosporangiaceae bacterium]
MRFESSVTSVSWIPSESVSGLYKAGYAAGASHPDDPPPDVLENLDGLFAAERFRFANHLAAWIEVEDGRITDTGYAGRGYISCTRFGWGPQREVTFQPAEFPELRTEPEITATGARFTQTTGGRTGAPMPRPVTGRPHVQWLAPTVWTTLALAIGTDGSSRGQVTGASAFPRHWIYDGRGQLVAKSGLADFREWMAAAHGQHSPWGNEDSQPLVTVAESALERQLSATIMRGGAKPAIRKLPKNELLTEQGEPGGDVYLLLDGILSVWVDGTQVAELGPGAVVGERALLEHGRRTATLRAATSCVVATAAKDQIDPDSLASLAELHRREDQDV